MFVTLPNTFRFFLWEKWEGTYQANHGGYMLIVLPRDAGWGWTTISQYATVLRSDTTFTTPYAAQQDLVSRLRTPGGTHA